ncbi:MAG: VCBS repeat-containing protein [Myxococcales bacterium]|nr:VCBS repeat-containing protein [Myxococcales bacterium]
MRVRLSSLSRCLAGGLLLVGCGRTGMDFPEDELADGGFDGGDERGDGPGFDDGEPPDDRPLPDPPLPESCSNGVPEAGELCFLPQVEFWSRIDPCALDVGDIDGDGHLDVATPNSDFEHVESSQNYTSVLYGNGLGALSEPVPYVSADDIPVGVRLGDLDSDGGLDLVVVNSDAGSITVLLNFGDKQMGDAGRVTAGAGPVIADLGDLNSDGVLDLAVTASDEVRVAFGRGDGNFEPSFGMFRPGQLWATRLLDLDGNGTVDMLASNTTEATVHMWHGDGQGQLFDVGRLDTPGMPLGIADADIDGNGTVDLLIAQSFGMSVFLGDGGGGFFDAGQVEAGYDPRDIAIADFDNDGLLDAAIVNSSSQDVTVVVGRGNGEFDYGATYAVGSLPSGIETGDFNSDGVPDLAISNQLSNTIGLILSDP